MELPAFVTYSTPHIPKEAVPPLSQNLRSVPRWQDQSCLPSVSIPASIAKNTVMNFHLISCLFDDFLQMGFWTILKLIVKIHENYLAQLISFWLLRCFNCNSRNLLCFSSTHYRFYAVEKAIIVSYFIRWIIVPVPSMVIAPHTGSPIDLPSSGHYPKPLADGKCMQDQPLILVCVLSKGSWNINERPTLNPLDDIWQLAQVMVDKSYSDQYLRQVMQTAEAITVSIPLRTRTHQYISHSLILVLRYPNT